MSNVRVIFVRIGAACALFASIGVLAQVAPNPEWTPKQRAAISHAFSCAEGAAEAIGRVAGGSLTGDVARDTMTVVEASKVACISRDAIEMHIVPGSDPSRATEVAVVRAVGWYTEVVSMVLKARAKRSKTPASAGQ